jgi:hypothetical protein
MVDTTAGALTACALLVIHNPDMAEQVLAGASATLQVARPTVLLGGGKGSRGEVLLTEVGYHCQTLPVMGDDGSCAARLGNAQYTVCLPPGSPLAFAVLR